MKKRLKALNNLLMILFFFSVHAIAQEATEEVTPPLVTGSQEKVIYEYKKEDYFDFEALSVKGELLTPGDLSGKAVKRVKFNSKDYIRKNYDDYIEDDLMEIY